MTAPALEMVPVAKIRPSEGNPRREFDEQRMAELVASVKRHGIITPLTLAPDENGGYVIVAGERRYRAAKAAKLRQVPAQVRDADGQALTMAVAENVIRADLNPVEEARAYRRLVDDHGAAKDVAKLVGKSERLIAERLDLLRLPDPVQELLAARRLPLGCAPLLVRIAEGESLLAELTAAWLADRPGEAASFPADPGETVADVLRAEWRTDDEQPVWPVAYTVSEFGSGPTLPTAVRDEDALAGVLGELGPHAEPVAKAWEALPEIVHRSECDWQARQEEGRRYRGCLSLNQEDADAARAFGCLLELPGRHDRRHAYVTDPEWLADRLTQKITAYANRQTEREQQAKETRASGGDDAEKQARREQRQRDYEQRTAARARNLDLGAALARWQPKLDTDAVKLLGSLVLIEYGKAAAWAHRLCVEQPTTTSKQGKVTVRYPRGAQAERDHHEQAVAALKRARTPEQALAVVLRLLVAQRLVDTSGLPGADRQGVYEPRELAGSKVLAKLARRVAPPTVRQHLAEQEAERGQQETERLAAQVARLTEQRARLDAGELVRCECCLQPITTAADATEKHGALVHTGDCEQQWGSANDDPEETP